MVSGVPFGTLSTYVSTINISGIVELTARAEIVGFDGKWASAFFTVLTSASYRDTIISRSATITLWAYCMMFTRLKVTYRRYADD